MNNIVLNVDFNTDAAKEKVQEIAKEAGNTGAGGDNYAQGNADLAKRKTLLAEITKATNTTTQAQKGNLVSLKDIQKAASAMADEVLNGMAEGLQEVAKETGQSIEDLVDALNDATEGAAENAAADKTLKQRKKELQEQIAQLILAGETESETFRALVAEAGEIGDAIGDASGAIARAGSDTRGLDNTIQIASGITAAFGIAEGAAALFGDENEDLQKTLLKVNSAMTILNGLQQIQAILRDESIKALIAETAARLRSTAMTAIENGLQSTSVIVRGLATAAQWALNAAMSANPIGLLVVAIAGLITILAAFSRSSEDAAESQKNLAEAEKAVFDNAVKEADILNSAAQKRIKQTENEIKIVKARGASVEEIQQLEKKLGDQRADLAAKNKGYYSDEINNVGEYQAELENLYSKQSTFTGKLSDDQKKEKEAVEARINLLEAKVSKGIEIEQQYADVIADNAAEQVARDKENNERSLASRKATVEAQLALVEKGSLQELNLKIQLSRATRDEELANTQLTAGDRSAIVSKSEKEIRDLRRAYQLQGLQDDKASVEARLVMAKKGSLDELNDKIAMVNAQRAVDLANMELTEIQRKLIRVKANKEIADLNKSYDYQEAQDAATIEVLKAQQRVAKFKEGSVPYLQAQKDLLSKQADQERLTVAQSEENEGVKAEKIQLININLNKNLDNLDKQHYDNQLARQQQTIKLFEGLQLARLKIAANDPFLNDSQRFTAQQNIRTHELANIDQERAVIHQRALDGQYKSYQDYQDALTTNTQQQEEKRAEIQQSYAERQKALYKAVGEAVINTIGAAVNSVFNLAKARRDADYQDALQKLEDEKTQALSDTNLTEQQKAQISKQYEDKEKQLKRQAAQKERKAQILQAIAQGVLAAITSYANFGFPYGLIAAAASVATTGIYIAELSSTPIASYKVGRKGGPAEWARVNEAGPELIEENGSYRIDGGGEETITYLKRGAKVYTAQETKNIFNNWDKDTLYSSIPETAPADMNDFVQVWPRQDLDYDRLASAIVQQMPPPVHIENKLEADGWHSYLTEGNARTEYKNTKYSFRTP